MTENRLSGAIKRFLGSAVNALERLSERSRARSKEPASERVLLVCVLYGKEFLEQVLDAFLDIGIHGATVLQSQGMGRILGRHLPLFAGFKELLEAGGPFNYTVMSVIEDPLLIDEFIDRVPSLKQGESSKGVLFTLPVSRFMKMDDLPSKKEREP